MNEHEAEQGTVVPTIEERDPVAPVGGADDAVTPSPEERADEPLAQPEEAQEANGEDADLPWGTGNSVIDEH